MAEWKQTEPGRLALLGSLMAVHYQPHAKGDFSVFQGDRFRSRHSTLWMAKDVAEKRLVDLVEIGAVSVE